MRRHKQGTEGRAERQGIETRDTHGHGHCQTELLIIGTTRASHERGRDEHSHEHQGGGEDSRGDAVHGFACCRIRLRIAFVELRLYSFDNDDGIINHSTDDEHESKERQEVQ